MKTKLFHLLSAVMLVSLLLTACAPAHAVEQLTVLIDNDEGPITPANFNTFIGFWMVGWVYDSLYIRTPDLEPIPSLATSATPNEDGLTWTVTLRDGVKWHDGEDFNADDVIFSYNFLIAAGRANNLSAIESMEKTGDYGLTIKLKEPQPFFLNEGLAGSYILPEHIWEDQLAVSGELSQFQGMVGTGAYKLVEVEAGQFYRFEANPDYFRGEPVVKEVIAKIVKDRTQQFNQLQTSEADAVLSSVPPAVVGELEGNADLDIAKGSDFFNYIFY
ncbi:MAG TPA: ABC transporter substrate-binding protein, partial [Anaerolineales bacterium]|nr:ABC transporter substrate-binding protein [Anaerolineales bacterium]